MRALLSSPAISAPKPGWSGVRWGAGSGGGGGRGDLVDLFRRGRGGGSGRLGQAVGKTLEMGSSDPAAVRYLMMTDGSERQAGKGGAPTRLEASELGALVQYERPLPNVQDYDQLLRGEVIQ